MKRVIIESPLAGDVAMNRYYAKLCMRDCLSRSEAPFASHLLYDQIDLLDDRIEIEREQGMAAGFEWGADIDTVIVYEDLGISDGMKRGIGKADQRAASLEYRRIEGWEKTWELNQERVRRAYYFEQRIGILPAEFQTFTIIAHPDGNLESAGSPFTIWQLRGLLETCASRIEELSLRRAQERQEFQDEGIMNSDSGRPM